jgi:hypothetical protein
LRTAPPGPHPSRAQPTGAGNVWPGTRPHATVRLTRCTSSGAGAWPTAPRRGDAALNGGSSGSAETTTRATRSGCSKRWRQLRAALGAPVGDGRGRRSGGARLGQEARRRAASCAKNGGGNRHPAARSKRRLDAEEKPAATGRSVGRHRKREAAAGTEEDGRGGVRAHRLGRIRSRAWGAMVPACVAELSSGGQLESVQGRDGSAQDASTPGVECRREAAAAG